DEVCRLANVLKSLGVKRGDRVSISMPMIPEAVYSILACARIGAIHSVIFGGFSADSIANRIEDCERAYVITADAGRRGGKLIRLKDSVDAALEKANRVKKVLVFRATGEAVKWNASRDVWAEEKLKQSSSCCEPEPMDAEDPLFILYTSGSTNKPK